MRIGLIGPLVAGSVVAVLLASPASATTFTTSSVSVTDSINGPNVAYSLDNPLNANLTIGTPVSITAFIDAHVDGNSFSAQSGTISATINFSTPTGASGNTDSGTITALLVQTAKHISITWTDPITVSFTGGLLLSVDLANVDFDCGTSCNQKDFFVDATFTQLGAGAGTQGSETPIPGALPLFASGLGALGLIARRRKRKPIA